MSVQIKRLKLNGTEFVPITVSEAVVVNTEGTNLLPANTITTLDKVLATLAGQDASLVNIVNDINTSLESKFDINNIGNSLGFGLGVIGGKIVITESLDQQLYTIVSELPLPASQEYLNKIYLVRKGESDSFVEWICVNVGTSNNPRYIWDTVGELLTNVDLSGYYTSTLVDQLLAPITATLAQTITAEDVLVSSGGSTYNIKVDYNLDTSAIYGNVNSNDFIIP